MRPDRPTTIRTRPGSSDIGIKSITVARPLSVSNSVKNKCTGPVAPAHRDTRLHRPDNPTPIFGRSKECRKAAARVVVAGAPMLLHAKPRKFIVLGMALVILSAIDQMDDVVDSALGDAA